MEVATLECGAKQITLNHDDNYEILFLNEEGVEVAQVFPFKKISIENDSSVRNHLRFSIINYDENNNRKVGYDYSVSLGKRNEELVEMVGPFL
jgi:hypothetical protein